MQARVQVEAARRRAASPVCDARARARPSRQLARRPRAEAFKISSRGGRSREKSLHDGVPLDSPCENCELLQIALARRPTLPPITDQNIRSRTRYTLGAT
eukprot:1119595-Pyramimonas_sp.AAC.1